MHLVFTWIQWCGKWTQARLFAQKYWFEIVEMWWEFRKVVSSWSDLWIKIKKVIDAWYLVDDKLWSEVMKQAIDKYKSVENVIFDAFVRLTWNKELFDKYLPDYKVVNFNLSEEKAKKRLLWRMYNPSSWETFPNGILLDPKTWDNLIKRKADNEAAILKRIEEFVNNTLPILETQRKEWRVIDVNADQKIEDVFSELEAKLWFN